MIKKKNLKHPTNIKKLKIQRFQGKKYQKILRLLLLTLHRIIYIKIMCAIVIYTPKILDIILISNFIIIFNPIPIISFFEFRNNVTNTCYKGYAFITLRLLYFFRKSNSNNLPTSLCRKSYILKFLKKKVHITFDREKAIQELYINIPRFNYIDINYYFKLKKENLNDIDIIMLKEYIYRLILFLHKRYDKNFLYLKTLIYTQITDEKERVFDFPVYCYTTDTNKQIIYCNKLFGAMSKIIFDEYYIYVHSSYIVFHIICKKDIKKIPKFFTFKLKKKYLITHLKKHFKFNENDYEIQ